MTFSDANSLVAIAAIVAGYGAYRADEAYVPVVAPVLDWMTEYVYLRCSVLPPDAWCLVSGLIGGLLVYLALALLLALAWRSGGGGPLEAQLRRRIRRQNGSIGRGLIRERADALGRPDRQDHPVPGR